MITTSTWERRDLFRNQRWAKLLIDTLYHYRGSAYLLHAFVIMPDHLHAMITPITSLEKAVQFIKGGFSYRAKKELRSNLEVWQKGFADHRVRDAGDYRLLAIYVAQNPVRKHLCELAERYAYSPSGGHYELDDAPQWLKPFAVAAAVGAAEAAPFQIKTDAITGQAAASQSKSEMADGKATSPLTSHISKISAGSDSTTDDMRAFANDQRPRTND
jgi:putative transposase